MAKDKDHRALIVALCDQLHVFGSGETNTTIQSWLNERRKEGYVPECKTEIKVKDEQCILLVMTKSE